MSCETWDTMLTCVGLMFEMCGAFLMCLRFTNVRYSQVPLVLITAIWRGKAAHSASDLADFTPEKNLSFVQGLSFVALGFVLQTIASLLECGG